MAYFKAQMLTFLSDLSANNNTHWFHAHRSTYEQYLREPLKLLVEEMISRISEYDEELEIEPRQAIFRINRDIRFSKDKRPYKTAVSANIQPGGKKAVNTTGFYFHFSHESAFIGGGAHSLDKTGLNRIRNEIAERKDVFVALREDAIFREKYGEILGDKNRRLPKEFQDAALAEPLLFNKTFYYVAELAPETVLQDSLPDLLLDYYLAAKPLNDFFRQAMSPR